MVSSSSCAFLCPCTCVHLGSLVYNGHQQGKQLYRMGDPQGLAGLRHWAQHNKLRWGAQKSASLRSSNTHVLCNSQRERELLDSAREYGEKESKTIIKDVAEKLPPPMIMQQDKHKVCRPKGQDFTAILLRPFFCAQTCACMPSNVNALLYNCCAGAALLCCPVTPKTGKMC